MPRSSWSVSKGSAVFFGPISAVAGSSGWQHDLLGWFNWYNPNEPNGPTVDDIVISWDTAMKPTELSDYSVGTVWGVRGDLYYLLDLVRVRLDFLALKRKVIEVYERWAQLQKPIVLIEDAALAPA